MVSDNATTILVATAICLFATVLFLSKLRQKSRPRGTKSIPGPWAIPVLGHLPLLGSHPPSKILKWSEKYGPIISLKFGSLDVLVLNELADVREAFNMAELSGRPTPHLFDKAMNHKGIVFAPTLRYAIEQRQFVSKNFRHFGQCQANFTENKVLEEIYQVESTLRSNMGQPIRTMTKFNAPLVNSFWSLVTGKTFSHDDPELNTFSTFVAQNCELPDKLQLLSFFVPWTSSFLVPFSAFPLRAKRLQIFLDFIQKEIKGHSESRVEGQPRDFIDAYLDKSEKTTDETSSFHEKKNAAPTTIFDIFTAGMETASTGMDWILFLLAKHQDVQHQLYQEIESVVGHDRPPALADRPHLPYTEAVIHEMYRLSSFNPFGFFHSALQDVVFKNHFIPKDTIVISNLHALHHDPKVWNNPDAFDPERFLIRSSFCPNDRNVSVNKEMAGKILPFGCGKRYCIGQGLAQDQIFLYTARLFQQFHIQLVGGLVNDAKFGFTIKPPSHELIFNERQS